MGQTNFIPGLVKDDGIKTTLGQLELAISPPVFYEEQGPEVQPSPRQAIKKTGCD